jgi:hypothetical protein
MSCHTLSTRGRRVHASQAAVAQRELILAVHTVLAARVTKPIGKFVAEMVGAIARARTVLLRACAEALDERGKAPGTVENRLSANLQRDGLWESLNAAQLAAASAGIEVYTPIAIDLTDTQRPYAVKTPGVEPNYDGSTGRPGRGYTHLCAAAITRTAHRHTFAPLYQDTFGLEQETTRAPADNGWADSTFAHYEQCVKRLSQTLGGPVGIDVMDRGMDDKKCFGCELSYRRWFIIRVCDRRRHLQYQGRPFFPVELYQHMMHWHPIRCRAYDAKTRGWRGRHYLIAWLTVGVTVAYPDGSEERRPLTLLAIRDRKGRRHMLLLTNLTIDGADDPLAYATMLYQAFLSRWGVETCFDLLKNRLRIEDIRVKTYIAAKNLFALAWFTLAMLCDLGVSAHPLCRAVLALYHRFHRFTHARLLCFRFSAALAWLWTIAPVSCSFH